MVTHDPIRAVLALLLASFAAAPSASGQQERAALHVRSTERQMLDVLHEGCDRSPTFKGLVDDLEGSDVIVYVEPSALLPQAVDAYMRFAGATSSIRYLRVVVSAKARGDRLIALVGHELQHAREVASATAVRDQVTLAAMYRLIGDANAQGWDTEAACAVGARVRDELQRNGLRANGQ